MAYLVGEMQGALIARGETPHLRRRRWEIERDNPPRTASALRNQHALPLVNLPKLARKRNPG
jgi:hypothetical protein